MAALGCLLLMILPIIGFLAGQYMAGLDGAWVGAAIGLVGAIGFSAVTFYALLQAGRRR
ncbi:hypothetical protein ACFSUK_09700 [Sphingobium scionense]|jgi:hypothetical protein|uniref:Uncharacterized protein n=1 Tax=Sphingobium scionense TaxID=1404341 RepID=A0A7W6LLZ8_9SPHN|nr:hypothetical protein [Sphingobium scionense]